MPTQFDFQPDSEEKKFDFQPDEPLLASHTPTTPAAKPSVFLKSEERTGTKFVASPSDDPTARAVDAVESIPGPAWKAMGWFQRNVNAPLDRMAAKGAEKGGEALTRPVLGLTSLQHPPTAAEVSAPLGFQSNTETPVRSDEELRALAGKTHPVLTGVSQGLGEFAGGMVADPRMWPLMVGGGMAKLPSVVQRLISAGFSAQMLAGAAQQVPGFMDAVKNGDTETATKLATHGIISGTMGALSGLHAMSGHDSVSVMERAQMSRARSRAAASGEPLPAPSPAPAPPPEPTLSHISPESMAQMGGEIAKLPPAERAQAMLDAHQQLSEALVKQGRIIGPDGKIVIVKTPEQAEKFVADIINGEVDRIDKVSAETVKGAEKAAAGDVAPSPITAARAERRSRVRNGGVIDKIEDITYSDLRKNGLAKDNFDFKPDTLDLTQSQEGVESKNGTDVSGNIATRSGENGVRPAETTQAGREANAPVQVAPEPGAGKAVSETPAPAGEVAGKTGEAGPATEKVPAAKEDHGVGPAVQGAVTKGSAVTLADGRKGTVSWTHPKMNIVRVRTEDGKTVSVGARSVKLVTESEQAVPVSENVNETPTVSKEAVPEKAGEGAEVPAKVEWTRESAEKAVKSGKDVPASVLSEYPDLQKYLPASKRIAVESPAEQSLREIREKTAKEIQALSPDKLIDGYNKIVERAIRQYRALGLTEAEAKSRADKLTREFQPSLQDSVDRIEALQGKRPPIEPIAERKQLAESAPVSPKAEAEKTPAPEKFLSDKEADQRNAERKAVEADPKYQAAKERLKRFNDKWGNKYLGQENTPAARKWRDQQMGLEDSLSQAYYEALQKVQAKPVAPAPSAVEGKAELREVISTAKKEYQAGQRIAGTEGGETTVLTPSGRELAGRYRVVDLSELTPSHDPQTFQKNAAYPAGVQERTYDTSKEAQQRVIEQAQKYDPRYTLNTNPDAVNGPPIVTPDGIVLGGNSRTMSTARLYRDGNGNQYKGALLAQAHQFGLDKEAIRGMERPMLVREVESPKNVDELRDIGRGLNKSMTGALGVTERAVSAGKAISRETMSSVAGMLDNLGEGASLRDLMRERGADVLKALVKDGAITERERPQFVDTATGGLSEEGKTFVERALLGSVVDDPRLMDSAPKSVLNKLDSSLASLSAVAPRTDAYNILPLLREALRDHAEIAQRGMKVDDYLNQGGLFGGSGRDPAVDAMVRLLANKPTAVKERLRRFAEDANFDTQGQATLGLMEQPSPSKAFNDAFGSNLTDKQLEDSIIRSTQNGGTVGGQDVRETPTIRPTEAGAGSVQRSQAGESRPSGEGGTGPSEKGGKESEAGDKLDLFSSEAGFLDPSKLGEAAGKAAEKVRDSIKRVREITDAAWEELKNPAQAGDYEKLTGKWTGAEQVASQDLAEFAKSIKEAVPEKPRREAITNWIEAGGDKDVLAERASKSSDKYRKGYEDALNLNPHELEIAQAIKDYQDHILTEAQKAGIVDQGVENYMQHIWDKNEAGARKVMAQINFKSLQPTPAFSKQRTLPTYFDGEQLGFKPVDKDAGFLAAAHGQAFEKAMASRAYIKSLFEGKAKDGRPLAVISRASAQELPATEGHAGAAYMIKPNLRPPEEYGDYGQYNHPALRKWRWADTVDGKPVFVQGDVLLHPEVYQKVKNNLGTSAIRNWSTTIAGKEVYPGRAILRGSSELKQLILSFSGFHQTTLAVHALEHRVSPFRPPELDLHSPNQRFLVDHGLMVADFNAMESFAEGLSGGGVTTKVPVLGPLYDTYKTYLFKSYLPRLKMALAQHILERNKERYDGKMSEDEIGFLSAQQANAALGHLNYKMLGRNPTFQDSMRLLLLAPDFLEARGRFAAQALKPRGKEQLSALVLGAAVLYTATRAINMATDDNPHLDKPFSVVYGGKEYALRTVQGDMWHLVSDPRGFAYNRLNPIVRTGIESLTGRDEMGRPTDAGNQLRNYVKENVPIPVQPWTQDRPTSTAEKIVDSILKMTGINEKMSLSKAEETARDIARKKVPPSEWTTEERDRYYAKKKALDGLRKGDSKAMDEGVKSGMIRRDEIRDLRQRARLTPLEDRVHGFSYKETMEVYEAAKKDGDVQAMTRLLPILRRKRMNLMEKGRGAEAQP